MGCKMDFLASNGTCRNGDKPCEMSRCDLWDGDFSDSHDDRNDDYAKFIDDNY